MAAVSTIVFVHAHPDDEASQTSGTMTLASRAGHRVVVVYGTNGDHGEVPDDLGPDDTVITWRKREAEASAQVTGTARVCWLGYADSGMTGWEQNNAEGAFALAPLEEAGRKLADILDEEDADVVIGYDWHGGYGHPDHVKIHHVLHSGADQAKRRPRVLESTMDRDHMRRMFQQAQQAGVDAGWDPDKPMDDGNPFGTPEGEITWRIDVRPVIDAKRAALACHASQKTDIEGMLGMPEEIFAQVFGYEYLIEPEVQAQREAAGEAGMQDALPF